MRMMPARYLNPKPARIKPAASGRFEHVSAPIKGLSKNTKLTTGDPLTATILTNWVIEDDRIQCRAGYQKVGDLSDKPIGTLIPFYGSLPGLLGATDGKLLNVFAAAKSMWAAAFLSDDWSWTSFANFSQQKFTVMCNGVDGVWSWDGGEELADAPVAIAAGGISKANPAVVTVAAGDIGKFSSGANVSFSGLTGDFAAINGTQVVGTIAGNTFTLPAIDSSAYTGTSPATNVVPLGSLIKENITGEQTWISPDQFQIVLAHQNRLFFADSSSLAVFYLPPLQKSGVAKALPLSALFKRGGTIRAMATWTVDGGTSMNDQLCIFTSNGELAIFSGIDPEADFQLAGVFRFDSPMSKTCVANYGGDLYCMISTGLVPMSAMLKAEQDQLGQVDRNVISIFREHSTVFRANPGWSVIMNPSSGRMICNIPHGASNAYHQLVRHMPAPLWTEWEAVPSRCWAWLEHYGYFGDDKGNVYRMHPQYLSDDGNPITVDVQMSWSQYKTPGIKHFKMIHTYMVTSGNPQPAIDMKVNYDYSEPVNKPEMTIATEGAEWDTATWDVDAWAGGERQTLDLWNGVAAIGRVGGPRLKARIKDCTFAVTGWDVLFEPGAAI